MLTVRVPFCDTACMHASMHPWSGRLCHPSLFCHALDRKGGARFCGLPSVSVSPYTLCCPVPSLCSSLLSRSTTKSWATKMFPPFPRYEGRNMKTRVASMLTIISSLLPCCKPSSCLPAGPCVLPTLSRVHGPPAALDMTAPQPLPSPLRQQRLWNLLALLNPNRAPLPSMVLPPHLPPRFRPARTLNPPAHPRRWPSVCTRSRSTTRTSQATLLPRHLPLPPIREACVESSRRRRPLWRRRRHHHHGQHRRPRQPPMSPHTSTMK